MKWGSKLLSDPQTCLSKVGQVEDDDWHGPLSCLQLNSHVHIQQWYWPLTPRPDAITILESHQASRLVHNTININVLWLRRLWKNFLPHQYWWCCHTLESGPSLRIYKRNAGGGGVCMWKGPVPFLVSTSMMYIFLPFRAISVGEGWLQPTLDEIWAERGCAETDPIPSQCFAGDDSYGKMNVSFQGIWEY